MTDFIVIAVIAVIVIAAITYIVKAKKSGVKCVGCSAGCNCSSGKTEEHTCSCGCQNK